MSDGQQVSMDAYRFATAAVNILDVAFMRPSRAQAKRHFARVQGGGILEVASLRFEDESEVAFRVALDHSEFRGRCGFSTFRAALGQLLSRLAERIRLKGELNVYTAETGALLFNVPAIIRDEGQVNVMMLGVDAPETGVATLRLQFLDPAQFVAGDAAAGTAGS